MENGKTVSAAEAAHELGISVQTLYSYVSRGLLRSHPDGTGQRARRYESADVRRLKERQELRTDPKKAIKGSLDWGSPIRSSSLTLIEDGHCYYRGRDGVEMARNETPERAAAWLWLEDSKAAESLFTTEGPRLPVNWRSISDLLGSAATVERLQIALPIAALTDAESFDLRPEYVAATGARILRMLVGVAAFPAPDVETAGAAEALQAAWLPQFPDAGRLLAAALIVCADHELNVSSFTARCAASAGATPYGVVGAGLAALQGTKHGGMTERVEALFREIGAPDRARSTLLQRARRGESIPGFGHPLYPRGDPRGRLLLDLVAEALPNAPGARVAAALAEEGRILLHEEPNVDFGLCALCAALGLPDGTALALFALGRSIGWIAHAIEEYQTGALIRPRAQYTGTRPASTGRSSPAGSLRPLGE